MPGLVLTRRLLESVVIGEGPDAVTVTVVRIGSSGQVGLAFEAPRHVPIDRQEVRDRDRDPGRNHKEPRP